MKTFAAFALSASLVLAAGPSTKNLNTVEGTYVEARNADIYTGPCFANAEMTLAGLVFAKPYDGQGLSHFYPPRAILSAQ